MNLSANGVEDLREETVDAFVSPWIEGEHNVVLVELFLSISRDNDISTNYKKKKVRDLKEEERDFC